MRKAPSFIAYLVTWFGAGYAPKASGTFGSLSALGCALVIGEISFLFSIQNAIILFIASIITFMGGIWLSNRYMQEIKESGDHKEIVIDEVAGLWLTLAFLPHSPLAYLCGFALFRFFDILKPFPISWLDKHCKGGFGVMADDMLAGAFAAGTFLIIQFFLQ